MVYSYLKVMPENMTNLGLVFKGLLSLDYYAYLF